MICLLLFFSFSLSIPLQAQTTVLDFDNTSNAFTGCGGGFSGGIPIGVAVDPTGGTNMVFEVVKAAVSDPWAGICTDDASITIDLTTDHQFCIDFYEGDATGTLRVKLEEEPNSSATEWEYQFNTTMGWGTYCIDTNTPSTANPGVIAAGTNYAKLVVFPDFGAIGTGTDETYYFDNVMVNPITCPLSLTPGTATCVNSTAGTDTYDATFTFSQTTAHAHSPEIEHD